MEAYPDILPIPSVGYTGSQDSNTSRTRMTSGRIRQRKIDEGERFVQTVTFTLTDLQFFMFASWFKHKITAGQDWFNIDLEVVDEVEEYEARFVDGKYEYSDDNGFKIVKAQIEFYNPNYLTEDMLDALIELGGDYSYLPIASDDLYVLVNETLPLTYPW